MKKALEKTVGLIIIALLVGKAMADIGKTYEATPNTWTLPITIFVVLFSIWITGYWAGKSNQ